MLQLLQVLLVTWMANVCLSTSELTLCKNPKKGLPCILICYSSNVVERAEFYMGNTTVMTCRKWKNDTSGIHCNSSFPEYKAGVTGLDKHVQLKINSTDRERDGGSWGCSINGQRSAKRKLEVYTVTRVGYIVRPWLTEGSIPSYVSDKLPKCFVLSYVECAHPEPNANIHCKTGTKFDKNNHPKKAKPDRKCTIGFNYYFIYNYTRKDGKCACENDRISIDVRIKEYSILNESVRYCCRTSKIDANEQNVGKDNCTTCCIVASCFFIVAVLVLVPFISYRVKDSHCKECISRITRSAQDDKSGNRIPLSVDRRGNQPNQTSCRCHSYQ